MGHSIRIGTSGWNYKHWREIYYPRQLPADQWFQRYCQDFDTVEINNTFYQLPAWSVFDGWREQAPPGFIYAVKANRYLTHMLKLKDPAEPLDRLLSAARRLGSHLGPVLFQLPPRWKKNVDRLKSFCAALPTDIPAVIEFRSADWLASDVFDVLSEYRVALCIHDLLPQHPGMVCGPLAYVRFHGVNYGGSYPPEILTSWAEWALETSQHHDVYIYFNNDIGGHAIWNAQSLLELVHSRVANC